MPPITGALRIKVGDVIFEKEANILKFQFKTRMISLRLL